MNGAQLPYPSVFFLRTEGSVTVTAARTHKSVNNMGSVHKTHDWNYCLMKDVFLQCHPLWSLSTYNK